MVKTFRTIEVVDRRYPIPSSLPLSPHFPPPSPPLPYPFFPTSLPLSDFSLPLIKCSYSYIYVSEELRMVDHRLSCRIFMHNYPVGKEPDYLQMNVFSRTSKGNIIYTRQNKNLLFMLTFGAYSILSLFGILRILVLLFSYKKFIKKKFANLSTS